MSMTVYFLCNKIAVNIQIQVSIIEYLQGEPVPSTKTEPVPRCAKNPNPEKVKNLQKDYSLNAPAYIC